LYLDAANPYSYVSGSTNWNDLSKSQINGSLINGPTFNAGSGGSIVFDGINDYVVVSSSISPLSITSSITLETWLKSTALADINHGTGINSKGISSDGNTGVYETLLVQSGIANIPLFRMRIGSSTPTYTSANIPLNLNQVYHFVSTYNGSIMRIYINGIESGVGSPQTGSIEANSQDLAVGVRYTHRGGGGSNSFFTGSIFINKIYNRALSPDEVLQNYNATKGRFGL
jgi:hypothetical protein